jgi:RNA polymerase sigma-B factor
MASEWEGMTTTELLRKLRDTGDPQLREYFIRQQEGLVRHVAKDYVDSGEPVEDLVSVGMIGLINAVDRFDPDRGVKFATFAVPTIRGEIRRYFRDHTWAIRVPRRIQELSLRAREAQEEWALRRGRAPTYSELAQVLNVTPEDLVEALEVGRQYESVSLESTAEDDLEDRPTAADRAGEEDRELEALPQRDQLVRALRRLQPRERVVIILRYFHDLSQQEVGKRLGVSQMHVSRLQHQALRNLRKILGPTQD